VKADGRMFTGMQLMVACSLGSSFLRLKSHPEGGGPVKALTRGTQPEKGVNVKADGRMFTGMQL
jgi:hypothetical protein